MKKIFTLLLLVSVTTLMKSQSFVVNKVNNSGLTILGNVANNAVLTVSTSSSSQVKERYRITNTSASTYSYNIVRTILVQNPPLVVSGASVNPQTFFCFGSTCFPNNITTCPTVFDYTILGPGEHTDSVAQIIGAKQPFYIYLDEDVTIGNYVVRYKVFNVSNPNDSLSFTIKYNDYLSVNENESVLKNVSEIFPNPTNNSAQITVGLRQETIVKVQIYNSLGSLVYNGNEQKLLAGKQKINVDCTNFNNGIYFVTLNAGGEKITKRMVINK